MLASPLTPDGGQAPNVQVRWGGHRTLIWRNRSLAVNAITTATDQAVLALRFEQQPIFVTRENGGRWHRRVKAIPGGTPTGKIRRPVADGPGRGRARPRSQRRQFLQSVVAVGCRAGRLRTGGPWWTADAQRHSPRFQRQVAGGASGRALVLVDAVRIGCCQKQCIPASRGGSGVPGAQMNVELVSSMASMVGGDRRRARVLLQGR